MAQSLSNGIFSSSCGEVCGDGKKFVLPCDDGNLFDGDGCNSTCGI
jgi:cysteine-rich repeat protein